ncbi:MAG: S-layer homology domain-containing protein [Patescibacteria group bacterium]
MLNKTLLAAAFFILAAAPALAAPTIVSAEDQSFSQNQNIQQARDITITDDAATPAITAKGGIRIHLPKAFPIIWDDRVNSVNLSGTAVDAGRFGGSTAAVTYEDADKTAVIAVAHDFAKGESVKVAGLVFEGFYWADANARLELILTQGTQPVAVDTKSLQVWTSTIDDSHEPEAPSGLKISETSDHKVLLTWTDPPDMDAKQIEILRGKSPLPVSGTPFTIAGRGDQSFTDSDVAVGDTVSYILRANDGRNLSPLSAEVSLTVVANPEPAPTVCTTDYTPVCGSDGQTYSNACNAEAAGITSYAAGACATTPETPTTEPTAEQQKAAAAGISVAELESAVTKYSDLEVSHWSAGFLARLNVDKIIDGYPDGTIKPDQTINRAELAKIATNSFALTESDPTNFADVPQSAWFASFVGALQKAGASWTTSENYFPAEGVSRGEAVWVLVKAAGFNIPAISAKPFPDVSVSHPYAAAIAWAKANEIISGYDDGTFGIRDTLTRAQVAKIVVLLKEKLNK